MSTSRPQNGRKQGKSRKRRDAARAAAAKQEAKEARAAQGEELAVPEAEAAFEPVFADFACVPTSEEIGELAEGQALGRVVRLDRGYPLVVTAEGSMRAEHAIALVKGADVRACLGDWVVVGQPEGHDKAVIERICARTSELSRWDGRSRGQRQVLAANVDVLLVAQPLSSRTISPDRLVRSLVLAREGGMRMAALLTKVDRVSAAELERDRACVQAELGEEVPVIALSTHEGIGLDEVRSLIDPDTCALLLGESGAGKSTLVNALLGAKVLGTSEVRSRDDQGRHTTVARRMFKLPASGLVVDAPGLRSLPLLDEDRGLALAFPEISGLDETCRFRDCTHGNEPGCALREAVEAGEVRVERLERYRTLVAEMRNNRRSLDLSAKASITATV